LNPALIGGQGDAEMPKLRLRCHGRRSSFRQQMEIEMTTQPGAEKASTALGEAKEMQLAPLKIGKFLTSAELKVELWAGGWGESGCWVENGWQRAPHASLGTRLPKPAFLHLHLHTHFHLGLFLFLPLTALCIICQIDRECLICSPPMKASQFRYYCKYNLFSSEGVN